MKRVFLLLMLGVFSVSLFAGDQDSLLIKPSVVAARISEVVVIDGELTEAVYKGKPIDNFTQRDPNEGSAPTEKTNVWFAYDENSFYIGAKMYDSQPDSVVGILARRDDFVSADWLFIFIDSYLDKRNGFIFGVNAAGSICDGTMFNDGWEDYTWNGVWESRALRTNEGWQVEMRIPFSQLRFNEADDMTWGVNVLRRIIRKQEDDFFVMIKKGENGFVSRFAELSGFSKVPSPTRLEILPYFVQDAKYLVHDGNDPFYKSKQYETQIGADVKWGISSNLNLDLAINPDFGQVEVDPAVVNLSATETYFEDKRPFFIEGADLTYFGMLGSNNNWNFSWGSPELFYSRRIGRAPRTPVETDGYVSYPNQTRILSAAKLTGKLFDNWSVYALNAVTPRTYAQVNDSQGQRDVLVEPLANYSLFRTVSSFNDQRQGLGIYATSVFRDLGESSVSPYFAKNSLAFGLDGWTYLDSDKEYVLTGYAAASYVSGSTDYITRLQQASYRYAQRPDATYSRLDPTLTSLSGFIARVAVNKQTKGFYLNSAFGIVTPNFDINDLGFQWKTNAINGHLVLGYEDYDPDGVFRQKAAFLAWNSDYDFEGNPRRNGIYNHYNVQFQNYFGFNGGWWYNLPAISTSYTRGGPKIKFPSNYGFEFTFFSDSRRPFVLEGYAELDKDALGSVNFMINAGVEWKISSNFRLSITPGYSNTSEKHQWVGRVPDESYSLTYGARYVFGEIKYNEFSATIRANWTFSPQMSLQVYLQPLIAYGDYANFKQLHAGNTDVFDFYGKNGSTITYNSDYSFYTVDPDGEGPASEFSFYNPNFNFKSLRFNLIYRYEFLPGSVLYLVWSRSQENYEDPTQYRFGKDFSNLLSEQPNNVFLIKFSYWFSM